MKTILAYGDSNTWGLIPGRPGIPDAENRYPWAVRWTGILQEKVQAQHIRIIEEGLCGRTTMFEDSRQRPGRSSLTMLPVLLESHGPLDAAVLMLGTNDCKTAYRASVRRIGEGIALCLDELERVLPPERILLISPVFLGDGIWDKDPEFDRESVQTSRKMKAIYEKVAGERGTGFLAASDYTSVSDADYEHMADTGHLALADAIYGKLADMGILDGKAATGTA